MAGRRADGSPGGRCPGGRSWPLLYAGGGPATGLSGAMLPGGPLAIDGGRGELDAACIMQFRMRRPHLYIRTASVESQLSGPLSQDGRTGLTCALDGPLLMPI